MCAGLENLKMQVFWSIVPCYWEYSSQHPRRLECSTSVLEPPTSHQKTCYMSPESNSYPQITVYKQFKIRAHFFPLVTCWYIITYLINVIKLLEVMDWVCNMSSVFQCQKLSLSMCMAYINFKNRHFVLQNYFPVEKCRDFKSVQE